ncbi:hypothetical protein LCGC14_3027210, partial [marine sediment metagenome]
GESNRETRSVRNGDCKKSPINKNQNLKRRKNKESIPPRVAGSEHHGGFSGNGEVATSELDKFTGELAVLLKNTIKKHAPSSLMSNAKIETYTKDIRDLILKSKLSKIEVKRVLSWYSIHKNYSGKYTPKIRKRGEIYTKFSSIKDAMERSEETNGEEDFDTRVANNDELINKVRVELEGMGHDTHGPPPSQDLVDVALNNIGYDSGFLDRYLL